MDVPDGVVLVRTERRVGVVRELVGKGRGIVGSKSAGNDRKKIVL